MEQAEKELVASKKAAAAAVAAAEAAVAAATAALSADFGPFWLASSSCDGSVRLWDVGELKGDSETCKVLWGHEERVWCVAFSCPREGEDLLLASCSEDKTVRLWDPSAADGRIRHGLVFRHTETEDERVSVTSTVHTGKGGCRCRSAETVDPNCAGTAFVHTGDVGHAVLSVGFMPGNSALIITTSDCIKILSLATADHITHEAPLLGSGASASPTTTTSPGLLLLMWSAV